MRGIDLEKYKIVGRKYLELAARQLREHGSVVPFILLTCSPTEPDELIDIDPRLLASESRKDAMAESLHARIREGGFMAVSSMFEADSLQVKSPEEGQMIRRLKATGLSIPEIHGRYGLGIRTEMVFFSTETISGDGFELLVEYRRVGDTIEVGPVQCRDGVPTSGRMKFFGEQDERPEQ